MATVYKGTLRYRLLAWVHMRPGIGDTQLRKDLLLAGHQLQNTTKNLISRGLMVRHETYGTYSLTDEGAATLKENK
jgi:predicted transcriptional regulator